jgi:AbrB family looped-hinge helix DNA binding protein
MSGANSVFTGNIVKESEKAFYTLCFKYKMCFKMTLSLTKMSPNGQVVIPAEVRKSAKLKPAAQFIVLNKGRDIVLKQVTEEEILHEIDLMERIDRAEEDFKAGRYVEVDSSMSSEEIDDILMS